MKYNFQKFLWGAPPEAKRAYVTCWSRSLSSMVMTVP